MIFVFYYFSYQEKRRAKSGVSQRRTKRGVSLRFFIAFHSSYSRNLLSKIFRGRTITQFLILGGRTKWGVALNEVVR